MKGKIELSVAEIEEAMSQFCWATHKLGVRKERMTLINIQGVTSIVPIDKRMSFEFKIKTEDE